MLLSRRENFGPVIGEKFAKFWAEMPEFWVEMCDAPQFVADLPPAEKSP